MCWKLVIRFGWRYLQGVDKNVYLSILGRIACGGEEKPESICVEMLPQVRKHSFTKVVRITGANQRRKQAHERGTKKKPNRTE